MGETMCGMTPIQIARVCGGSYFGDLEKGNQQVVSVCIDSRQAEPGGLFVAIRGNRVDGNAFVEACYEKGVLCCVSEKPPESKDRPYIQVSSSEQALKDMAEYYRQECGIPVIGITGSVGKTTTKEMVYGVLAEKFDTLKTQGNFNNEIGLPLTLLRLRSHHQMAVVEMGISDFGEMTRLAKTARPDACIITNIGQCHLENLGTRDGILKAKTEIFTYLKPQGRVYLNGEDDKLATLETDSRIVSPVFFGVGRDFRAENIKELGLKGIQADLLTPAGRIAVCIPSPGRHMIANVLAAAAVGLDWGLSLEQIKHGIEQYSPLGGRSRVIATKQITIMDDCYNANPVSMKAGLEVLSQAEGRKVAVLGDMFELGQNEELLHRQVGNYVADEKIDLLLAVGELAKQYVEGAKEVAPAIKTVHFQTMDQALDILPKWIQKGDSVLVKASHGMKFEKIVDILQEI